MSVLRNLRWFQPALRVSVSLESVYCNSKRYKYRKQNEMFEAKEPEKGPDDDNIPWWSKIWSDRSPTIPFPVEFRKRVLRKRGFSDYFSGLSRKSQQKEQLWSKERHEFLGPDLSAAHFVLFRKGGVKFRNCDKWIYHQDKEKDKLPLVYEPEYVLTGIDISSLNLRPEALTNFQSLIEVTHLSIANNPRADDWWLDTLSGELPSLRHLNISGCPHITYRGISVLYRLQKLESLMVEGIEYNPFLEITFLELERLFSNLTIYGIEHWDKEKNEEAGQSKACETNN